MGILDQMAKGLPGKALGGGGSVGHLSYLAGRFVVEFLPGVLTLK